MRDLLDLTCLLSGIDPAPPTLDNLLERFLSQMTFDFEDSVWRGRFIDEPLATDVVSLYNDLDERYRVHFLLSPALCEALSQLELSPSKETLRAIRSLLWDHVTVATGAARQDSPIGTIWCAMGDEALVQIAPGQWERISGDRLGATVLVDFDSRYAHAVRSTSGTMNSAAIDFSPAERKTIVENSR